MESMVNRLLAIARSEAKQGQITPESVDLAALLNSISHELRTPLASITGVLTSLSETEKATKKVNRLDSRTRLELLESATDQAIRLNQFVENLLDMSRLEAGALQLHKELTEIQDLIGSVVAKLGKQVGNHHLEIYIPPAMPPVSMDSNLMAQVLVNILDNAIKYSPVNSPIDIEVDSRKEEVLISIKDRGIGIPLADLNKVFDKFYRVQQKRDTAGTGLGLSICKGIVEAHGGQISIVNNPDKGVTVSFTLPLQERMTNT
jgi:two-component system sensor histidine kinase KdpD